MPFLLLLGSFLCAAIILFRFLPAFWDQRNTFGAFSEELSDLNTALLAYFFAGGCFVLYMICLMFHTISRKRKIFEGRQIRFDSGRGMIGFLLLLVLVLAASKTALMIPDHPYFVRGFTVFLRVITSCRVVIGSFATAGIVLCIVRKILKKQG